MSKLSDTQAIILSTAAQRPDGNLLPLPGSLRGGAATKVVGALLTRGLIRERITESPRKADPALNTIWRSLENGRAVLLFITSEGFNAIGVDAPSDSGETSADEADAGVTEPAHASRESLDSARQRKPRTGSTSAPAGHQREGTKQAKLIAMLRRKQGATIAQIVEATGWQPHTVRGAFAGVLKKRLGLTVVSEKVEGKERVYRLPAEG